MYIKIGNCIGVYARLGNGHEAEVSNAPTHCNTLQHCITLHHTAPHCNTLQHTALHCNTLHHTAKHCKTLQNTATHCNTWQYVKSVGLNILQHTASYCNTLQQPATHTTRPGSGQKAEARQRWWHAHLPQCHPHSAFFFVDSMSPTFCIYVTSRFNKSRFMWTCHVVCEGYIFRVHKSCRVRRSRVTWKESCDMTWPLASMSAT